MCECVFFSLGNRQVPLQSQTAGCSPQSLTPWYPAEEDVPPVVCWSPGLSCQSPYDTAQRERDVWGIWLIWIFLGGSYFLTFNHNLAHQGQLEFTIDVFFLIWGWNVPFKSHIPSSSNTDAAVGKSGQAPTHSARDSIINYTTHYAFKLNTWLHPVNVNNSTGNEESFQGQQSNVGNTQWASLKHSEAKHILNQWFSNLFTSKTFILTQIGPQPPLDKISSQGPQSDRNWAF